MDETIVIDAAGSTSPFPHFWEHMFGSCHASITLCEDWRNDLRTLKEIVDVKYVRFHGIFERAVGIYDGEDEDGNLVLNFTRLDLIYDGLLRNGVRPFVELSFMPGGLAAKEAIHSFWNHPNLDFWAGNPTEQTYYELYKVTANALKAVNPLLRVGGPATAQAAWVDRFIQYCAENKVPVDFVS